MRTLILALTITSGIAAAQPRYETKDGCDAGRWSEWESIIIGFEGDAVEQEDARKVRDFNRRICERMDAGELTQEQANELYDAELDAWVNRIEKRKEQRSKPKAGGTVG